ncbi:carbon-nitrogen hydrolase family protein [Micromonospora sp. ATCC 39149]|uniref:Carbon-nitrogen hydrolase family protein n=1 Tax=Micromonospora carbonacea TaxID=47853 RepID=A0A7D5Y4L1_9ACTN|nr:carbon-nitrogen hydrolase family protein [Micromonospora sp. ATCC 39149]QLJ96398.1 carbon-nitrogen hydrolase family protein [Micromonospora carbonacea]
MTTTGDNPAREPLRVAAAQIEAAGGDLAGNAAAHVAAIASAATRGARLVVFPELSLCGYDYPLLAADVARCEVEVGDPVLRTVGQACRAHTVTAVVGGCARRADGWAIAAFVVGPDGAVAATYHKRHLDADEREVFVAGHTDTIVQVRGWRLGLGVCYDASFPEHARGLALAGADAYLVPGAFTVGDSDHRRGVYFPARALENTSYVVFANYAGAHGGWRYAGHSAVYGPDGGALAAAGTAAGLAVADLDDAVLRRQRDSQRMLLDRAAPAPAPSPVVIALP